MQYDDIYETIWGDDDAADLANQCAVCGHDYRDGGHDDDACAASQD